MKHKNSFSFSLITYFWVAASVKDIFKTASLIFFKLKKINYNIHTLIFSIYLIKIPQPKCQEEQYCMKIDISYE
jgi:hypothetical protein